MPPSHHYRERDYEFANTFVALRTTIGLTQQSLAVLLGVSSRAVENWEQGLTNPKAEYLKQFIALCVQASAFAAGREEEQIRAFWHAAHQKIQLDEYWLSELFSRPSPSPTRLVGEQPSAAAQSSASSSEELALWTVPYARNPHFTGRDELLSQLERQFARRAADQPTTLHHAALTQAQAIKGLGGIGKTQTAIEYAYRAREQGRYTHTLWISAASEEAVIASFTALKDLVPALGEKEESDQHALVNKALRWLEQCPQPWLLIYDNADETAFLPPYLPIQGQGSLLFTTRASAVGALAPSLEVDVLPLEEGVQLLLRRAGRAGEVTEQQREEANAIVLALGQFPLAIDQAGAYVEETGCRLADYLRIYQRHQYQLLARRGKQANGYPDSVATTWSLAFEQIERSDPAAAELLRLCAFVAPDQIPEELLTEGAAFWPAVLQEAVTDRWRFNQMLSTLLAFSLIKRVGRARQLSIHRLVQMVQQARMTPEEQRQWAERLLRAVHALFPADARVEVESWTRCQRLLEQAQMCDHWSRQYGLEQAKVVDIVARLGIYLRERGSYAQAEALLRRTLHLQEQRGASEELPTAEILLNLANLLCQWGKLKEAELPCRRGLHIREQRLGPEHPDVVLALSWLAKISSQQGKLAQAEGLEERVLHIREQQLGPDHPQVADSLYNLAITYYRRKRYSQVEDHLLRALRIREQQVGPEDVRIGGIVLLLAALYIRQGKYEQAEPLFQRAVRLWTQQLGGEHPYLADALQGLAEISAYQGQDDEAEALYRRAIHLLAPNGQGEDSELAFPFTGLATLYARQGKDNQAEALYQQALRLREQHQDSENLETSDMLQAFAQFRHRQGRLAEAATLYRRALAVREQQLECEHPLTSETRAGLREVLRASRHPEEAAELPSRHPEVETDNTTV